MKSLEYIKQRIEEGNTGLTDCNYENMTEVNTLDILSKMYNSEFKAEKLKDGVTICRGNDRRKIAEIYYNPNIEFNYFSMSRCTDDGSLYFDLEMAASVLGKVMSCQTYNRAILFEVPVDKEYFETHYLKYTVGDIVLCHEYDDKKFATKEKPWLKRRTTALLPIKFEVIDIIE